MLPAKPVDEKEVAPASSVPIRVVFASKTGALPLPLVIPGTLGCKARNTMYLVCVAPTVGNPAAVQLKLICVPENGVAVNEVAAESGGFDSVMKEA